jgi:hypothetical protein
MADTPRRALVAFRSDALAEIGIRTALVGQQPGGEEIRFVACAHAAKPEQGMGEYNQRR